MHGMHLCNPHLKQPLAAVLKFIVEISRQVLNASREDAATQEIREKADDGTPDTCRRLTYLCVAFLFVIPLVLGLLIALR
jgi:hypothetical protein